MENVVKIVKSRELGKKIACPRCQVVHVIRKTGTYRCTRCQARFRGVMEDTANERPIELVAAAVPPRKSAASARCARHPGKAAYEACSRCGDFTCPACIQRSPGGVVCLGCTEKRRSAGSSRDDVTPGVGPGIGDILGATFSSFPAMLPRGVLLALPPAIVGAGAVFVFAGLLASGSMAAALIGALAVFGVAFALQLVAQVGLLRVARSTLACAPQPTIVECFSVGLKPVLRLGWTQLLSAILIAAVAFALGLLQAAVGIGMSSPIGALVLVAVMVALVVFLGIRFALLAPAVVYEERSGLAAINRSFALVGARPGAVIVCSVVMLAPLLGIGLAGKMIELPGLLGVAIGLGANAASTVLVHGFLASLYWGISSGESAGRAR